jgi:hypothetical protein
MEASSTEQERYFEYRRMMLVYQFGLCQNGTELGIKECIKRTKNNNNIRSDDDDWPEVAD